MIAVKICGLTNLPDARWAWQCGADLLGFIFVPSSPRYIEPREAGRITAELRAEGCTARFVGVFAGASAAQVARTVEEAGLDLAQLHGAGDAHIAGRLKVPAILARWVRERVPWEEMDGRAWAYLLDTHREGRLGGTGEAWSWEMLGERRGLADVTQRIIVAGGLSPENVAEAVRVARPWGVDVSSGVEVRPGVKDPARVKEFIEKAKAA